MPPLCFEQHQQAGGRILDGKRTVAEIHDLHLVRARCTPGGDPLFGTDVPVPLYWQQYAHHQDPERNAGSQARIECVHSASNDLILACSGSNASGAIQSRFELTIRRRKDEQGYEYHVSAGIVVEPHARWHVTPNPIHGEIEFLNLWPHLTFSTNYDVQKRYRGCYVERENAVTCVPHHHLDSSDKRNIVMRRGDRFLWLLEDENPVVEILSEREVTAGICAYMWDAHFAYRVCSDQQACDLQGGARFDAEFLIYSVSRDEAVEIERRAVRAASQDLGTMPIYVPGVNRFSESLPDGASNEQQVWPWSHEVVAGDAGDVQFEVDRKCGYDDRASLRIDSRSPVQARWCATTLGPAFGGSPFGPGRRYRLTAMIRSPESFGKASIALRMHRSGNGSVFDLQMYEVYSSDCVNQHGEEWMACELVTPAITPAPDRIHILLEHNGTGTTWFDNVLFEELP
jgi:hypothetical protein